MIDNLKQFKLSNDDEVICEVVQWNDEDNDAIIVRGALRVIYVEDFGKSIRFFAFRPWMVFHDDPTVLHTINSGHIIAETTPSQELLKHYASTLDQINNQLKSKKYKTTMPLDEITANMHDMDDDEFERYIQAISDEADMMEENPDSDMPENVVRFKPKTVH